MFLSIGYKVIRFENWLKFPFIGCSKCLELFFLLPNTTSLRANGKLYDLFSERWQNNFFNIKYIFGKSQHWRLLLSIHMQYKKGKKKYIAQHESTCRNIIMMYGSYVRKCSMHFQVCLNWMLTSFYCCFKPPNSFVFKSNKRTPMLDYWSRIIIVCYSAPFKPLSKWQVQPGGN